jgi:uncharacterized protein
MLVKGLKFELKEIVGNAGEFLGLASVFGNVDATGDLVEHGAFTKTLQDNNSETPILWAHDPSAIVGIGRLRETQQGLEIRGQLVLDSNEVAQKAYALMKAGAVKGLSIGYDAVKHVVKNGVRILQEVKLYEVSLTGFPANAEALVTSVKQTDHREELAAINQLRQVIRKVML